MTRTTNTFQGWGGKAASLVFALFLALLPSFAMAGEANVTLKFSQTDRMYLMISLAFGVISIIVALIFRAEVNAQSPGNEKMQEVGKAIREGALAYLKQQGRLMSIFIVVLAALLFVMYQGSFGTQVAIMTVGCFILGVGASYFAGFMGMDSAINANMRTAHAALSSYGKALTTAFRSGAVAGLMTVGMGLLGATLIFLLAGENATKLLVGFGFGGSLAALFMRVGGGIYTKAADVGADLVGKVEAGIPEDDPRNPAVIADNVGDNVGDCAGMAADVFESYEVTLVAAIVLGAATASIFDQPTWMKLIMFALMARGIGIIASIIGIFLVKGSDSLDSDPLKAIQRGFRISAVIAGVMTAGLAWYMMGGQGGATVINTTELVSRDQANYNQFKTLQSAAQKAMKAKKKKAEEITSADIQDDATVKALNIEADQLAGLTQQAATAKPDQMPEPKRPEGFRQLDFTDPKSKDYQMTAAKAVFTPDQMPEPKFLGDLVTKEGMNAAYEFEVTQEYPAQPPQAGQPQQPAQKMTQKRVFGPLTDAQVKELTAKPLTNQGATTTFVKSGGPYPVTFFMGKDDELAVAVDGQGAKLDIGKVSPVTAVFKATTVEKVKEFFAKYKKDPTSAGTPPDSYQAQVMLKKGQPVPWWTFFACVMFGIVMAFAFEILTDYYVSLHKKPVQELGAVATAGPAPMIISGFAYGLESSVFNVFAIVAALIMPLIVFPVNVYGSYIMSFYGIALVGLGLLTTTGFILAMDTFGPISDNAQGVFEMSGAGHDNPEGARRVQLLDAAGNTTKALTKGFAIATAVVAAVALFHAYVEEGMLSAVGMRLEVPEIFLGMMIGGAAPYLFSAFTIKAVGRAAVQLIEEVRSQFRNDPGIMAGTSKPNYAKCVAIVTASAQKELLGPGILAIAFPVLVAFGFAIGKPTTIIHGVEYNLVGAQALGGFLAGTILSGQLMAVLLANSGGMWDNAKKLIEDGLHGGKGTEAHKAAVVCDTVGDPFKDTAGPALNPLIKVMNLVALLIVPQVIRPWPNQVLIAITVAAAAALGIAIWWSNRGGMSDMKKTGGPDEPTEAAA